MKTFGQAIRDIRARGPKAFQIDPEKIVDIDVVSTGMSILKGSNGRPQLEEIIAAINIGITVGQEMMKEDGRTTLEFKPDHVYLVFVDPAKINMESLIIEERHAKPGEPEVMFIPSYDGWTPTHIESVKAIEDWISEIKKEDNG